MRHEIIHRHIFGVQLSGGHQLVVELQSAHGWFASVDAAILRFGASFIGLLQDAGDFGTARDFDAGARLARFAQRTGVVACATMLTGEIGVDTPVVAKGSTAQAFADSAAAGLQTHSARIAALAAMVHRRENFDAATIAYGFFFVGTDELWLFIGVFVAGVHHRHRIRIILWLWFFGLRVVAARGESEQKGQSEKKSKWVGQHR